MNKSVPTKTLQLTPQRKASLRKASERKVPQQKAGFTLIELLITITIIGILAAIVIPSYNAQVRKSRRSDAVGTLLQIAQDLERCRSDTNAYTPGATGCTDYTTAANSPLGFYSIQATTQNGLAFTLAATPLAPQNSDTRCAQYLLDQTGNKVAHPFVDGTTTVDTATNSATDCW